MPYAPNFLPFKGRAKTIFVMPLKIVKMRLKPCSERCDIVLVVGSPNSSNSNRLRELAERMGAKAYLIDNAQELQKEWFAEVQILV
jgi:4-hydroxy-3-methylbut-2-enyl diphosphate reductase IspH